MSLLEECMQVKFKVITMSMRTLQMQTSELNIISRSFYVGKLKKAVDIKEKKISMLPYLSGAICNDYFWNCRNIQTHAK